MFEKNCLTKSRTQFLYIYKFIGSSTWPNEFDHLQFCEIPTSQSGYLAAIQYPLSAQTLTKPSHNSTARYTESLKPASSGRGFILFSWDILDRT